MQKVGKALRQTRGPIVAAGKLGPMQRRRPLSLRQTLFIGAGLGMLLPALVLSYYQVVSKWDSEINVRVRAPVQQYADVLAHGLAAAIWNVDKAYASELTTAVMQNPDLVSVSVMDENKAEFVRQEKAAPSGAKLLHEERHIVHNGNRVGSLTLVLTTERVEQELAADLFKLGLALLAQVVISFACIWWLFEQRMMRPLKALLAGAQRLAGGVAEVGAVADLLALAHAVAAGLACPFTARAAFVRAATGLRAGASLGGAPVSAGAALGVEAADLHGATLERQPTGHEREGQCSAHKLPARAYQHATACVRLPGTTRKVI